MSDTKIDNTPVTDLDPKLYDETGNPRVQGIVSASIEPIKAKDLRIDTEIGMHDLDAGEGARSERKRITGSEEVIALHETRFVERTVLEDGKLDTSEPVLVRKETLEHAGKISREIFDEMHKFPLDPLAANLIAMAATILHYETVVSGRETVVGSMGGGTAHSTPGAIKISIPNDPAPADHPNEPPAHYRNPSGK